MDRYRAAAKLNATKRRLAATDSYGGDEGNDGHVSPYPQRQPQYRENDLGHRDPDNRRAHAAPQPTWRRILRRVNPLRPTPASAPPTTLSQTYPIGDEAHGSGAYPPDDRTFVDSDRITPSTSGLGPGRYSSNTSQSSQANPIVKRPQGPTNERTDLLEWLHSSSTLDPYLIRGEVGRGRSAIIAAAVAAQLSAGHQPSSVLDNTTYRIPNLTHEFPTPALEDDDIPALEDEESDYATSSAVSSSMSLTRHSAIAPDASAGIAKDADVVQDVVSFSNIETTHMTAQDMFDCLQKHGCRDLNLLVDSTQLSAISCAGGAFGDIFSGKLHDGTKIAVKMLRAHAITEDVSPKWLKRVMREIYVWSKTDHINVQELLGVAMLHGRLGMISLWMENGNLQQYIRKFPEVDRYELCTQVAAGVSYLHSIDMVHGDLKALNILVSDDGIAKISDFDHSILSDCSIMFSATTNKVGGTFRWMAPELVLHDGDEDSPPVTRNKQTDVYALGMTILETITGSVPYAEYKTDGPIYGALMAKKSPKRSEPFSNSNRRGEQTWMLMVKCWDHNPWDRPEASLVHDSLVNICKDPNA